MEAAREPFSLYVHIPYCLSKCPYCDFNSHVVPTIPEEEYGEALIRELRSYASSDDWQGRGVKTIFFGGGTPSTFRPASIARILEAASSLVPFERGIEITLEANPGSADSQNFSGYRACGVNRLSLGAQSFQDRLLKFLGRIHSAEQTREALKITRQAGFDNFSLDLIYAVPGQSLADLEADLEEAVAFDPPHLSAYNLTFEEGTPFYRDFRQGGLRSLPEETEVSMAELIEETLARHGLGRYEISNYARPGFYSRHNVNYWRGGDYLGIGAGAHSYRRAADGLVEAKRWHNEKNPGRYMERVGKEGRAVVGTEAIDLLKGAGEFMFLGLRMVGGISAREFSCRFGKSPCEFYPEIGDWLEEGLMQRKGDHLSLTRKGLLVANSIFVNFV